MANENTERTASLRRETAETKIVVSLNLDEAGSLRISTGLGFLDHMIQATAFHSGFSLDLEAEGDLHIDDHHTVEDTALVMGAALLDALGDRAGIRRFGYAYAPLDEALARAVIDLSGRPSACVNLGLDREFLGDVATENLDHFFRSLATAGRFTLHLDVLRGQNDHHRAEAAFKALGLALTAACSRDGGPGIRSTKGVL